MRQSVRREERLPEENKVARFEQAVLPHPDAAYNLARWLTRNDSDAEDVVQEAALRAFKFFGGFRGGDSRAMPLTIVRDACFTWLCPNRAPEFEAPFDEEAHRGAGDNPETIFLGDVYKERR